MNFEICMQVLPTTILHTIFCPYAIRT